MLALKALALPVVALCLASASPAVPQTQTTIPADMIARAKFPTGDADTIDRLAFINRYVNEHIEGISDQDHYGVDELWVMFPADAKGDCEDYALTKLGILSQAGFPTVAYTKIVGVMVKRKNGSAEGHAILALLLPSGAVMYLDNRFAEPMTRDELLARGYQFFDWRA